MPDPVPMPRGDPLRIRDGRAEAWAEKESHDMMKKWQERYFVIDPKIQKIMYYEVYANNTVVLKGSYKLTTTSQCKRVGSNIRPNKSNVLVVTGTKQGDTSDLYIAVSSSHVADEWIRLLNKAILGQDFNPVDQAEVCLCMNPCTDQCTIA